MPPQPLQKFNFTVLGVLGLFAFVYFTVVSCVIIPWLSISVPGVLNFGVLTFDTGLALACFLSCVLSDPGSVPESYAPDEEAAGTVIQVKRKGGMVRFCQKCQRAKPARAHHCRVCQRCVLRMDHHCPWINNCVGHANYKAFLLFLLYASAAVTHAMGLLVAHALHAVHLRASHRSLVLRSGPLVSGPRVSITWALLQTACTAVTLPLTLGLLVLLFWNGFLAANNRTTIEYHEGVRANVQALQEGQHHQHPYHLGLCSNLHAICGAKPHRWLWLDSSSADGDGLVYPTIFDTERQLSFL